MTYRKGILEELRSFLAIQSVSTDSARFFEVLKAASFLKKKLSSLGFSIHVFQKEKFPPLIIAERKVSSGTKTIGVYGHYDVQPEDPINEWKTKPFEINLNKGKIFGRGVADNKGSIMQSVAAIESLIKEKNLKNNIVFILEGEEETGSANFEEYVKMAKEILKKVNVFYITDVGMFKKGWPQIFYGLRGTVYFELEVIIGERDLHSGIYGNKVLNPAQILCDLFVKIKDSRTGRINIPHFYDRCRKIDKREISSLKKVLKTEEEEKKLAGVYEIISLEGVPPTLATKLYPSFEINGLLSGYTGEGSKTIIPRKALAKFSFRLVEYQDPEEIEKLVREFVRASLPKGVRFTLRTLEKSAPFYTSIDSKEVTEIASILEKNFGRETLFNRGGGTVPAAEILGRVFQKPIILTGFILTANLHSPNEHIDKETFFTGIEALKRIYSPLPESSPHFAGG